MEDFLGLLGFALGIIANLLIFKRSKLTTLKNFLYKLFWIDLISEKTQVQFARQFLLFLGKVCMYSYLLLISFFIFAAFTQIEVLFFGPLLIILYPLMYRLTMGIQRLIWGIR